MKIDPDSRMPRRLPIVRSTTDPTAITTRSRRGRGDRGDGSDAGRDGDCDRQHIVDQQRCSGHDARQVAKVVAGHDVAAGALG